MIYKSLEDPLVNRFFDITIKEGKNYQVLVYIINFEIMYVTK